MATINRFLKFIQRTFIEDIASSAEEAFALAPVGELKKERKRNEMSKLVVGK